MKAADLLQEVSARAHDRNIPLNVALELTLRCNIRCTHCYNFDRGERRAPGPELTLQVLRPVLDDLRAAGTLFISLTGGEALVHPEFWGIADAVAERGFALSLLTNGTLLTGAVCDRLAGYPNLWLAGLSLYGARAETHDAVTVSPGSFRRTVDGARRLRDRGVRTKLKFVIMKSNSSEAGEMVDLADREAIPCSINTTVTARHDGTKGSLSDRVDHATLETLYRGPLRRFLLRRNPQPTDDQFKCNCARNNAAISSNGDVHPCIAVPLKAGSIHERPFREIWKDSPVFQWIRGLTLSDFKTCSPCGLKEWCRRSPAPPFVLHGDYTGVDPWVCAEAEITRQVVTNQPR